MRRFYRLDVQPDLFGRWCCIREWGRIGRAGQVRSLCHRRRRRLDRLARSTRGLLNTRATITSKGAGFRFLNDTRADTTTAHGRLMLTVLGGLAEFERELIRARTGEGRRERAVADGT